MLANRFLATGLGSLPYKNEEDALEKIAKYYPQLPYWPQLPQRSKKELMLEAFLFPWVKKGLISFRYGQGIFSENVNRIELYQEPLEEVELLPKDIAPGFYQFQKYFDQGYFSQALAVKGQITGPNTLCKYNFLTSGLTLNHNQHITRGILKLVEKQLYYQINNLQNCNLPVIIFIDEPAPSTKFYELNYDILEQGLMDIIINAKAKGAIIGIHSCNKPDWFQLTQLPVDIISIDTYSHEISEKDAKYLIDFINKGGKVAWGIVPNVPVPWASIYERILKYKDLIKPGGLITASCGLGMSSEGVAEKVMEQTLKVLDIVNNF